MVDMKKDEASSAMDVIECLVAVLVLSFILIITFDYVKVQNIYMDANALGRTYIHTLEVDGCLTDEVKADLKSKLETLGLENISFEGTTNDVPEYGERVCLVIKADYKDSLSNRFIDGSETMIIEKYSIFKN